LLDSQSGFLHLDERLRQHFRYGQPKEQKPSRRVQVKNKLNYFFSTKNLKMNFSFRIADELSAWSSLEVAEKLFSEEYFSFIVVRQV